MPNNDWICDLCTSFGYNGKYLRCPVCTRRGGAMRKSETNGSLVFWKNINPNLYEFYHNKSLQLRKSNPYEHSVRSNIKKPQKNSKRKFFNSKKMSSKKQSSESENENNNNDNNQKTGKGTSMDIKEKSAFEKNLFYNYFTEADEYNGKSFYRLKLGRA